ncbi:MAG TPA: serine racemase VanT catalytic subunit [Treponemataceae bacterium]|nr:serine racemase VanT catalytic subunit [Treponemataceae bacterium]
MTKEKEYVGIDYFRIIAAFLVVAIHTSPLTDISETADFILTRVIARIAVPFFFMTSGFFLFSKSQEGKQSFDKDVVFRKLSNFIKKTAVLYFFATLFYLPLNIYAGSVKEWTYLPNFLKDIFFDGTFYHLWYLPAAIVGACIVFLLLKKMKTGQAFIICLFLYIIGLFGDSYYGISENTPFLKDIYQGLFLFSDNTRNGLFFAPIFFMLGALVSRHTKRMPLKASLTGLVVSFSLMLTEALLLHHFNVQRRDCMYFMLLPCMYFLFQSLLLWEGKSGRKIRNNSNEDCFSYYFPKGEGHKKLRNLSMVIYLIHPAAIVAVRALAKLVGLQELLIDNSIIHFFAVAVVSLVVATIFVELFNTKRCHKARKSRKSNCTGRDDEGSAVSGSDNEDSAHFSSQNRLNDGYCKTNFIRNRGAGNSNSKRRDIGSYERAWAENNLTNLRHNVKVIQQVLPDGCNVMAVVKANAYGHGDVPIAVELNHNGIEAFAVATIDEAIHLRDEGIEGEILILGYTTPTRAAELHHYRLSQTIADIEHAEELNGSGKLIKVHIKVNTGMNRLGENYQHEPEIASMFEYKNLNITGIFTHLCVSDSNKESDIAFTNQQIQCFCELLAALKQRNIQIPKIHIQSSYGVLNYPNLRCDYVRIGIALYGVFSSPDADTKRSLDLRPVLALKSKICLVRTIAAGESIGYGRNFIAQKTMKIAIVSIGYADGVPRSLSTANNHVLIRGCRVPIIGRICMDQLIVDVTDIPDIKRGDIATLIGKDGAEEIKAEQMAENAGTITNELLSRLSGRLERVFVC